MEAAGSHGARHTTPTSSDSNYIVDGKRLETFRADKTWQKDPKHFRKVKISAAAAMKMTTHAAAGVEKGLRSANRMPVEVMGLMLGHPDLDEAGSLVITDVFPLPVEGTETSVMTDQPEVTNYMIELSDALEQTRSEPFMGWYHSHPFDVGVHPSWFLSSTDVSTQLGWQINEDAHGNPWTALVVDPLRGIAKGRPEIGAFRCYPTTYTPPKGLAPDGVMWSDDELMKARWGPVPQAYHTMEVEYFMSSTSQSIMTVLGRDFMWARTLSAQPLPEEARERLPERLRKISEKVSTFESGLSSGASRAFGTGLGAGAAVLTSFSANETGTGGGKGQAGNVSAIAQAAQAASELATEHDKAQGLQAIKHAVFNARSDVLHAHAEESHSRCRHAHVTLSQVRSVLESRRSSRSIVPRVGTSDSAGARGGVQAQGTGSGAGSSRP